MPDRGVVVQQKIDGDGSGVAEDLFQHAAAALRGNTVVNFTAAEALDLCNRLVPGLAWDRLATPLARGLKITMEYSATSAQTEGLPRIIIAGSRSFDDYQLLKGKMGTLTANFDKIVVVSGTQSLHVGNGKYVGADYLGEQWAREMWHLLVRFHPDWDNHGKAAGMIRNAEMAKYATHLVAFWNGVSPGTKNMIEQAKKHNLKVRIVRYTDE